MHDTHGMAISQAYEETKKDEKDERKRGKGRMKMWSNKMHAHGQSKFRASV